MLAMRLASPSLQKRRRGGCPGSVVKLGARLGVVDKRGKKKYLCGVRAVRNVSGYLRLQRREFVQGLGPDRVETLVGHRMCTLGGQELRRRVEQSE